MALMGFTCGDNCFILEDNTIQPFATIGNDVVMWSGNHIGHHSVIKDHVFITSHVVVSGACTIEPHCFLGVNATIRDETILARETLVGAGALILRDTKEFEVTKPRVHSRRKFAAISCPASRTNLRGKP
jgi:UDP-3-O-[3-hydroxymyristoyl] glucosamine N-acyltransferase